MVKVPVAPQVQPQVQQEQVAAPQFQAAPSPGMQSAMQLGQDLARAGQMAIGIEQDKNRLAEVRERIAASERVKAASEREREAQLQNEMADAYATQAVDGFMDIANSRKDDFMLLEKQQAFESYNTTWADLQQQARDIGDKIQDPVVKQIYQTQLGPKMAELQRNLSKHANEEAKRFGKSVRESHINNLQADYARSDPEESPEYMQAVFGSAVVAIGQDLQASGIRPFVEDAETGQRSMSPTYLQRVREWVDDAAKSIVGNLMNQGRPDAASAYIKDLISMGTALSEGGTVGGVLDPATQVSLQRDISASVQRVSSPDLKIFDARTSELQDQAARAAGSGKTDDLRAALGDIRANVIAKNETVFPGIKPDDPRIREEMRDATTRVLTDGVDQALLGNDPALARSLVAAYEGDITAKEATNLQEKINTWTSSQEKLRESLQEKLQAKADKDWSAGIATKADKVSRNFQSIQEGGVFWSGLSQLMSDVGGHFRSQGAGREAVVAEQRTVANGIAATVVDSFITANRPDKADSFLRELAKRSMPRGEGDPSFSVIDHETRTALRGKVDNALADRDKSMRDLMKSVTNAEERNDAVSFATRLFDFGEYGGFINGMAVRDQIESSGIQDQQLVEIRDDSALVYVSPDSPNSQRDIVRRLSSKTGMRVELLAEDDTSRVFELRPRSGTNMMSGGIQVPKLPNGDPDLGAMQSAIESSAPNEKWRVEALSELNRRFSAAETNKARQESAVLDEAINQVRAGVLSGQAPSLDMISNDLRAMVEQFDLGEKALSIPREDNYVVMDNIYDDPGQYLNESYLKQNRYLLTETTYRRLLEQARNPDLPQDLPMSSDMFNDLMVQSGLPKVANPKEDKDKNLRYQIRSNAIREVQSYVRSVGKQPTPETVQSIVLNAISVHRERYVEGSLYGYNRLTGEPEEGQNSYIKLADGVFYEAERYERIEQEILKRNLYKPGMTDEHKKALFQRVGMILQEQDARRTRQNESEVLLRMLPGSTIR